MSCKPFSRLISFRHIENNKQGQRSQRIFLHRFFNTRPFSTPSSGTNLKLLIDKGHALLLTGSVLFRT